MIARFSLYGFLKNQRYFEPFIILFFLQEGLSFTQIGFLIAFREVMIAIMEIPTGAVADLFGRRRSMTFSFVSYIVSFVIFSFSTVYWQFIVAMIFFAIGEAFRTGTHKAMIFTWLRLEGRLDEKTKVYGYTRSWSKIGSVIATVLAVVMVFFTQDYSYVFLFSVVPYLAGMVNIYTYPKELEGQPENQAGFIDVMKHLWVCLKKSLTIPPLRRLLIESMSFEGVFTAVKQYLQPIVQNMALLLPFFISFSDTQRSSILIGIVHVLLYLGAAVASRNSHRVANRAGGEWKASYLLWKLSFLLYIGLVPLLYFQYYWAAIAGFILLFLFQNFWQPMLISRFDHFASESEGATILSIESQTRSVAAMIVAPLMGMAVDFMATRNLGGEFWPVPLLAGLIALSVILTAGKNRI